MERCNPKIDLNEVGQLAVVLVEKTLRFKEPAAVRFGRHLALATVPTPNLATGHERHDLGRAAVGQIYEILGNGAAHSVSHTRGVSVVVGTLSGRLGIDIERLAPARPRIARRILTTRELDALGTAPSWTEVLRCFCMKEAAYKVLVGAEQEGMRFRGLQLEDVKGTTSRVFRTGRQCVALATATYGSEVLLVIAAPAVRRAS